MLATIPVDFDHHAPKNGRVAFSEWASGQGVSKLSLDPVFRYGQNSDRAIAQLRSVTKTQPHVFLSNVVCYASVLTTNIDIGSQNGLAFAYDDVESLIESPKVSGYNVADELLAQALAPLQSWQVFCDEHSFHESSEEAGLKELSRCCTKKAGQYIESVLWCTLSDPERFAANRINNILFEAYFVPASIDLDFKIVADRFARERLGEYFLRKEIPFGTLGMCHMDDDIAVSFLDPVFDFPDSQRCFIR